MNGFSQKKPQQSKKESIITKESVDKKKDTTVYKTGYGLRLGVDLSKPALTLGDKSYNGLEIVADYRISKKWYIATELGFEEEITFEDFTTSTSKGNYVRLGVNYNTYKNWLDMNNEIFVGARYGFANFEQTLNSHTTNTTDTANPDVFDSNFINDERTETGLQAHWLEFQVGIKAETFKNLFLSVSGSFKLAVNIDDQTDFATLYAPGFNRVFVSNTGFGFNYTLSYLIPFSKK